MRWNGHEEFMLEIGDSFEYSSAVSIRMQSRNKGKDVERSFSLLTPFLLPRLMYNCMQISYLTKTSSFKKKSDQGYNWKGILICWQFKTFSLQGISGNKQMAEHTYLVYYFQTRHAIKLVCPKFFFFCRELSLVVNK